MKYTTFKSLGKELQFTRRLLPLASAVKLQDSVAGSRATTKEEKHR